MDGKKNLLILGSDYGALDTVFEAHKMGLLLRDLTVLRMEPAVFSPIFLER